MNTPSMRPKSDVNWLEKSQRSELVIHDTETGLTEVIYSTLSLIEAPNWSHDGGSLIFNGDGRLWRISIDGSVGPERINTAPVENLNNDHVIGPDGDTIFISSNDGHLYSVPIGGGVPKQISHDIEDDLHRHYLHGISPDGSTLAYVALRRANGRAITRIALMPSNGGNPTYMTDGSCPVDGPEYNADGSWVYYNSEAAATQPGHAQLFRIRPDGSDNQQLTFDERVNWFPHLSPDGTKLVYISFPSGTLGHPHNKDVQICMMDPEGGPTRVVDAFFGGQGTINVTSWAPDSGRFAYVRYPQVD